MRMERLVVSLKIMVRFVFGMNESKNEACGELIDPYEVAGVAKEPRWTPGEFAKD
jgi:hypothetical protein